MAPETATATATDLIRPAFDAAEWVLRRDVPVFKEHVAATPSGQPVRFGQCELERVATAMNRRIRSTGDYPQLCIGHTSDDPSEEKPSIGSAGPFRVGMIREDGKLVYAIFADFHLRREHGDALMKYPRRSVELHIPKTTGGQPDYDRMRLDPICLLGANAPRLDLGMTAYSVRAGQADLEVLRYSALAPAMPSATNVFLPSGPAKPRRYSTADDLSTQSPTQPSTQPSTPARAETTDMALSEEDLALLVDKLMQTKPMQFLISLMEKTEPAGDPAADPADPGNPDGSPGFATPGEPPMPAPVPSPAPAPMPAPAPSPTPGAGPGPNPEEKVKDSMSYSQKTAADDLHMKYSALAAEVERLKAERAGETAKLAASEKARFSQQKQQTLQTLRYGLEFDLDSETARCEPMDAAAFQGHVDTLRRYCARIPAGIELPLPIESDHLQRTETAKYSQANVEKAVKLTMERQKAGQPADYDTILAEVIAAAK